MLKKRFPYGPAWVIILTVSLCSFSRVQAADSTSLDGDSAMARIIELNVPVEINRTEAKMVSPGMFLTESDTLTIPEEGRVTLLFRDGTIAPFVGPAIVALSPAQNEQQQGVPVKLGSALLSLFFSRERKAEDVIMGTREPKPADTSASRVVSLLYPPPGCHLIASPRQLRWQPIEAGCRYTVSLFDVNRLLWQKKTNNTAVELPPAGSPVQPGNVYWWQVEAEVGDAFVSSHQAAFYILDETEAVALGQRLAEIDSSVIDPKLSRLLKASLYCDLGLQMECYREIQSVLKAFPSDYTASLMRAALLEKTSLLDQAVEAYKETVPR